MVYKVVYCYGHFTYTAPITWWVQGGYMREYLAIGGTNIRILGEYYPPRTLTFL